MDKERTGEGDDGLEINRLKPELSTALTLRHIQSYLQRGDCPTVLQAEDENGRRYDLTLSSAGDVAVKEGKNVLIIKDNPRFGKLSLTPESRVALETFLAQNNQEREFYHYPHEHKDRPLKSEREESASTLVSTLRIILSRARQDKRNNPRSFIIIGDGYKQLANSLISSQQQMEKGIIGYDYHQSDIQITCERSWLKKVFSLAGQDAEFKLLENLFIRRIGTTAVMTVTESEIYIEFWNN
ncbi:MAG: hypothetical protein WC862_04200 [Patescibacteria group bacterium]